MKPLSEMREEYLRPISHGEMGLLVSYHYWKGHSLQRILEGMASRPEVFVDSGGFSAYTQGETINLQEYASWLRRNREWLSVYANLDSIGDPRGTLLNQILLEREGLRPLPVIHVGTDPEEIRRYHDRGYGRMCLGGMVPHLGKCSAAIRAKRGHSVVEWMRECHTVAQALGVRLHGFGATNWPVLTSFPWGSADSSTWAMGFRFGGLHIFHPQRGRWVQLKIRDVGSILQEVKLLEWYGVDVGELLRDGPNSRVANITASARSWLTALRWLRKKKIVSPDFQLFLADSNSSMKDARCVSVVLSEGLK